jgi:isochorismate hydrolase
MTVINDAVADPGRETHAAELKILDRNFAAVKTTSEVIALVGSDGR